MDVLEHRILVTGAGGVLGTAVSELLTGHPSTILLRQSDCDLTDRHQVEEMWSHWNPTLVIHLAARVAGILGNQNHQADMFYENTLINANVVNSAVKHGAAKIIVAGTVAIYPSSESKVSESQIWDGRPHTAESGYAHSKRAMLAHLEACNEQYGTDYAYLVCSNLYGPNDRFDQHYGHVVPSLISRFYEANSSGATSLEVWGDGTPTRDLVFASDAAQAFLVAAANGHGAMNLGTGRSITIAELVECIGSISGYTGRVVWHSDRPNGQLTRAYDIGRLRSLGWEPSVSLMEGIRLTYEWYQANHLTARR